MTAPTPDITRAWALVPDAFTTPRRTRFIQLASWTAFLLLTGWCLWDFGFAPDRLVQGATRFGDVLAFMFPPHIWTSWAEWRKS